jgi:hypothetical protein
MARSDIGLTFPAGVAAFLVRGILMVCEVLKIPSSRGG